MVAFKDNSWTPDPNRSEQDDFFRQGVDVVSDSGQLTYLQTITPYARLSDFDPVVTINRLRRDEFVIRPARRKSRINLSSVRSSSTAELAPAPLPSAEPNVERLAKTAERIVREHFIYRCIALIQKLSDLTGQATAAPLAADLFFIIRDYAQQSPADPFADFAMSLHDALAANDFWTDVKKVQYDSVIPILKGFLNRANCSSGSVDAAIARLEEIGFDTIPFSVTK